MGTVDVLMKMPKIEGYEYTGEWRSVAAGEISVYNGEPRVWSSRSSGEYPILRKAEVWKPLTLEVAMDFAKNREKITLRYLQSGPEQGARFGKGRVFGIGFGSNGNYDRVTLDDGANGYIDALEYLEQ